MIIIVVVTHNISPAGCRGGLIFYEMAIQEDLQIKKKKALPFC
jgi:hypothetical protein